ncbi:hypothetical protein FRC08_012085 [Ceratobasidium sp. 394]|nr:hypothetical protein FRC08_012085 [Ceratobasidium sp. 394]
MKLKYPEGVRDSPSASYFYPHGTAKTVTGPPTSSLRSGSSNVPPASTGAGTSNEPVVQGPTPAAAPAATPTVSIKRPVRIRSDILMPRGSSLFDVRDSLHLLTAIHNALLGIMAFTEAGKIHCNISAYNLLLVDADAHYGKRKWLSAPTKVLEPARWDYNGLGTRCATADNCLGTQASTSEYKSPRLQRVENLGRGPVCVIHDTEFTINEDRGEKEVHSDRTGTPAFISAQLLDSYMLSPSKVTRTYVHDTESLLWVLIWVVAHRSLRKDRWEINDKAAAMIQKLSTNDLTFLCESKHTMLSDTECLVSNLKDMRTDLSTELAPVVGQLANFFYFYLYVASLNPEPSASHSDLDPVYPVEPSPYRALKLDLHKQHIEESRSQMFDRLFAMINRSITWLKRKHVLNDM